MNYELLKAAQVNVAEGVKRFAGKEVLYEKYLLKFLNDGTFEEAKAAVAAQDQEVAFRMVHTLKGAVGNLSINGLFDLCSEYCVDYRAGELDKLPGDFEKIADEYHKVIKAINDAK